MLPADKKVPFYDPCWRFPLWHSIHFVDLATRRLISLLDILFSSESRKIDLYLPINQKRETSIFTWTHRALILCKFVDALIRPTNKNHLGSSKQFISLSSPIPDPPLSISRSRLKSCWLRQRDEKKAIKKSVREKSLYNTSDLCLPFTYAYI